MTPARWDPQCCWSNQLFRANDMGTDRFHFPPNRRSALGRNRHRWAIFTTAVVIGAAAVGLALRRAGTPAPPVVVAPTRVTGLPVPSHGLSAAKTEISDPATQANVARPGDFILLTLEDTFGNKETIQWRPQVEDTGFIMVPEAGPVVVAGLTDDQIARATAAAAAKRHYFLAVKARIQRSME